MEKNQKKEKPQLTAVWQKLGFGAKLNICNSIELCTKFEQSNF